MIIVSGKVKVAPGAVDKMRGDAEKVIMATRKEAGCIDYSYGVDLLEPDTIIILEYWDNADALKKHFTQLHMAAWLKTLGEAGIVSQEISVKTAGKDVNPFG